MNKLERGLIRTRKTIREVCKELDIDVEYAEVLELDQCSSCSIWDKFVNLKQDLDHNLICKNCWDAYGP